MRGSKGLASLGPFLGAPAGSPGQVKYAGVRGLASPDPLLGALWCGAPVPQIMPVRGGGTACAVLPSGAVLGQG